MKKNKIPYSQPFENMGLRFRKELKTQNWPRIIKLLPTKQLTPHDTKILYKWAIKDKQYEVIEFLNTTFTSKHLLKTMTQDIFKQGLLSNDQTITHIISKHPQFDYAELENLQSPFSIDKLIQNKCFNSIEVLVKNGFSVNWVGPKGHSLLNIAVRGHHSALIEELLKNKVDLNRQQEDTLLMEASVLHALLIAKIGYSNYVFWNEPSVLFKKTQLDILKLLFQYNANPNMVDSEGNHAYMAYLLCHATQDKQHLGQVLELFLEQGLDLSLKNQKGLTLEDNVKELSKQPIRGTISTYLLKIIQVAKEKELLKKEVLFGSAQLKTKHYKI